MDSRTPGRSQQKVPFFSRLQVKYAMSYLAILAVVLVLLNTYPLIASQNLLFSSKRDSLKSQAAVMASALMELESLNADQVARVMNMLDSTGLSRVLVTDPSGLILYDSLAQPDSEEDGEENPPDAQPEQEYRYALFQEVVLALEGNDVVYSQYEDGRFLSTAATPIVYRGMTIGAIYLTEEDTTQGALLMNLQQNLRSISLVLVAIALTISFLFSKVLTSRIGALLGAIRIVGEGEYGHRLQPSGKDELAHLAEEFNQLTDRLQTTEEVRRRFVSDASHELKTPLASIRLLADSILQNQEMDQETVRDFVGDIGDEAERLTRITEHLLALTRLDSLPVGETQIVDMAQVTQRAINMLTPVAVCLSPCAGTGTRCCWRWPTPAWASQKTSCPRCSTASTGWTRPAPGPPAAPVWGFPSCGTRCAATAAGSLPSAARARAACSPWASPAKPPRWEVTCHEACLCPASGPAARPDRLQDQL